MLKTTGLSRLSVPKVFKAENDEVDGSGGRADEIIVNLSKSSKVKKLKGCQKSKNLKNLTNQ